MILSKYSSSLVSFSPVNSLEHENIAKRRMKRVIALAVVFI